MSDPELVMAQSKIYELQSKIQRLEKKLEDLNEKYMTAIDDVCWYHRELRRYIKQSKITERRKQDGKFNIR